MSFDFDALKSYLVCPQSQAPLILEHDTLVACDREHRLRYDIRDDIPLMLVDEATSLSLDEWTEIMIRHGRDPVTGDPVPD
jgi:uncharacterized protein YbaR (Trm112 family)